MHNPHFEPYLNIRIDMKDFNVPVRISVAAALLVSGIKVMRQ